MVPCEECIVFAACRTRYRGKAKFWMDDKFAGSIYEVALDEDCDRLELYMNNANQDQVNKARELFGMRPYP